MTNARKIQTRLLKRYPDPKVALHFSSPFELLIAAMLAAQCTDKRVNEVTPRLFKKFKTPASFAKAKAEVLESEIRSVSFFRVKARSIIECCKELVERHGGEVPSTMEELVELQGVGRKTANMVLGNAMGIPGIAVDTHVLRVSKRLGLTESGDPKRVEIDLMGQVAEKDLTKFGNLLTLHGRETCTARRPRCFDCPVFSLCAWENKEEYANEGSR